MIERLRSPLSRLAGSAAFAYGSVFAIQAKVIWGIWEHRDLPAGDSSNYFIYADAWADKLEVDPLFSPLYTSFWGTVLAIAGDVYAAAIAHRVIIVLAATLLVLAVLRRLLTPAIAWVLAVWWAVLPVNYDTINEVHLFSLIPVLVAALVALRWSGTRMRAAVFGILLGSAVLQRNELIVAAFAWLAICVGYEWWQRRRLRGSGEAPTPVLRIAAPLAIATAAVFALGLLSISRAQVDWSLDEWADAAQYKQDFALCQHYAVGYQQRRHADGNIGWQHCQMFMERDFGEATPSFTAALASNPSAMATHFGWNARLSRFALQLGLFDGISGSRRQNPDYLPSVRTGSLPILIGSLGLVATVAVGLRLLWVSRRKWWEGWIRDRAWGWALLGSMVVLGIWVAITTHPRPSYLFPLTFAVLAAIGMCAMAIADRWPAIRRARAALPPIALLLVVVVPPQYGEGYSNPLLGPGRGLADEVSRLEPYRDRLAGADTVLYGRFAFETCNYLVPESPCTGSLVGLSGPGDVSPAEWLDQQGIDVIYADERTLEKNGPLLAGLELKGWEVVGPPESDTSEWLLLARRSAPSQ